MEKIAGIFILYERCISHMIATAGCTIVSKNYLAYAKTLCDSFKRFNPDAPFYVLLVDELEDANLDLNAERYELIEAKSIGIHNFKRIAFRFDILELNTNVKPSFLKFLMRDRSVQRLLYLDPDILIASSLQPVFDLLDESQILLTPHCLTPITDNLRPSEQDFLAVGVFNLGFIGVKDTLETGRFLDWWEQRCLTLGFSEMRTGLFVDQKWCNLAPCLFDGVEIIKNAGWNMAYWNLHERMLSKQAGLWVVNGKIPLLFFHFSGVAMSERDQISRHQNRFDLNSRPDLKEIFGSYRDLLLSNGMNDFGKLPYKYGKFSNGKPITRLARSLFAANENDFLGSDPFDASGDVYLWCKRKGILEGNDESANFNSRTYKPSDWRVRLINTGLRLLLRILNAGRYTMLMKYLSHITVLRNQGGIHKV